jgi:hypothetical protein
VADLEAKRQPVLPELALLITPLHVTLSGKAPVEDPAELLPQRQAMATAAAAAAAAAGGGRLGGGAGLWGGGGATPGGRGGVQGGIGIFTGAAAKKAKALEGVPARQWRPVFHPGFTITGTQPVLVVPQVWWGGQVFGWFKNGTLLVPFTKLSQNMVHVRKRRGYWRML